MLGIKREDGDMDEAKRRREMSTDPLMLCAKRQRDLMDQKENLGSRLKIINETIDKLSDELDEYSI